MSRNGKYTVSTPVLVVILCNSESKKKGLNLNSAMDYTTSSFICQ